MDLIAALRTFLRVAETGSFSAVAAERGLTQPAVSRQVSALEDHLGARLVQRSTQAVTLTEEGRELLVAAQQLVDSAEALRQMTASRRGKPMGRVRLAVPVRLGLYLSDKIGRLLTRYEELSVDLVLRDGVSDLIEEGLDLEVRIGPIEDAALIARCIGWTTAYLVAAPSYLEGRCPPAHPRDLERHDCIVYHRWGRDDVWWFSAAAGDPGAEIAVSVRGRFRANNAAAVPTGGTRRARDRSAVASPGLGRRREGATAAAAIRVSAPALSALRRLPVAAGPATANPRHD